MPRIPGPCAVVIFGVTGDLARKKLMPAIYDLANRGLLPANFALVGFARRDWDRRGFRQAGLRRGQTARPHPVPPGGLGPAGRGNPVRTGHLRRREGLSTAGRDAGEAGCRAGHRRQSRLLPVDPAEGVPDGLRAAAEVRAGPTAAGPLEPGGHREAVRPRPGKRPGAEQHRQQRVPRGVGVPHRPLPRQGNRPEHPGAALRQRAVRADLERQLRRQRADHHGRGHRPRRPRWLLRRCRRGARRDPEPPDPADGADRDGGAGQLQPARIAGREDQGALGDPADATAGPDHRARSVHRGLAGQREGARPARGGGVLQGLQDRDVRRHRTGDRHPALGRRAVLPADRKAVGRAG